MKLLYLSLLVIVGGVTIGTAFAATFNESVIVNGNFAVNNGGFTFERDDGIFTAIKLKNNDKQVLFKFEDPDDNQSYLLRTTPGVNGNFELSDFSGENPVTSAENNREFFNKQARRHGDASFLLRD